MFADSIRDLPDIAQTGIRIAVIATMIAITFSVIFLILVSGIEVIKSIRRMRFRGLASYETLFRIAHPNSDMGNLNYSSRVGYEYVGTMPVPVDKTDQDPNHPGFLIVYRRRPWYRWSVE